MKTYELESIQTGHKQTVDEKTYKAMTELFEKPGTDKRYRVLKVNEPKPEVKTPDGVKETKSK